MPSVTFISRYKIWQSKDFGSIQLVFLEYGNVYYSKDIGSFNNQLPPPPQLEVPWNSKCRISSGTLSEDKIG